MTSQKIIIEGLDTVLKALSTTQFLYLTVSGLLNPDISTSRTNFTFTFINTSTTFSQAVLRFDLPLSYTISDPPLNIQIGNIALTNPKYYANSDYTFSLNALTGSTFSISKSSRIGLIIHFPAEYAKVWSQILTPSVLTMTINGNEYNSTNIRLASRYLLAVFNSTLFSSQVDFSTLTVKFAFKNPNETINCSITPVFTVSLFDFKSNSIYAQTLSNNQICPNMTTYLFDINITGNTRISAGSSSNFLINLAKPAKNMTIIASCDSSAISFQPTNITFINYT